MASWMVHLRLAENLLTGIGGLDAAQFAIGNIAPDSGIPDAEWKTFNPPPEVTHFKRQSGLYSDLDFYEQHLKDVSLVDDAQRFSFLLGYFFHLVTDNQWDRSIAKPTWTRVAEQLEADPEFVWEVKRDWYGLDFLYLRQHPEMGIWQVFLSIKDAPDLLPFLPAEATWQRIKYIQEFYCRDDEKTRAMLTRPFIYLSPARMDQFVETTTERLDQTYRMLWERRTPTRGIGSALDLLEAQTV